jgi:hypothetical protein
MVERAVEKKPDLESEVWSAIAAFEQILEAMPDDRSSLETLAHAYAHIGDQTRARDYLVRLGRVLLREGDGPALLDLREALQPYKDDADVAALLADMTAAVPPPEEGAADNLVADAESRATPLADKPALEEEQGSPGPLHPRMLTFRVADELALAWALYEAAELTQEEYAAVAQDLSEMSGGRSDMTVSVLHVLENRAFKRLERVVGFVGRQYHAPIVALQCFELIPATVRLLPLAFMIRRGALVFDALRNDLLVVVMNPSDKRLLADVRELTGRQCHFFVSLASEFDAALAGVRDSLGE